MYKVKIFIALANDGTPESQKNLTLTYLINTQDGISEYGGQNFLFST